ncbi:MAG: hypothetical protein EXR07_21755 [Acetobacteraceae bacterium]|nr:hypothetical protein [Acetobacteraceae bacterium]
MEHVRRLLQAIDRHVMGARVILLTSAEAVVHPNCQRLHADFGRFVTLRVAPLIAAGNSLFRMLGAFYERQWKNAESLNQAFSEIGPGNIDFILLPHLEAIGLLHLGLRPHLFRGKPWATIAIAVRFHHRQAGIPGPARWVDHLQRLFFWKVVRNRKLACFGTVDPFFASAVHHPVVVHCPDPCEPPVLGDAARARVVYGVRPETCVVLVFGFIDGRKCVDVLLEGAARVAADVDLTILLAGPQHSGHVAPILNGETARTLRDQGRLVEVNRFILTGQDIDPMSAADIAWVFYEPHFVYSSSVLVRSALSGKAVIVRRQGVMGRQVEENKCGLALSSDSPDAVAAALTQLARSPALRKEMGENGARAFAGNTPEAFARPIVDSINQALAAR